MNEEEIKKEFREKFDFGESLIKEPQYIFYRGTNQIVGAKELLSFILEQVRKAKEEVLNELTESGLIGEYAAVQAECQRIKSNIGFLRQWLNEDRITDPKKMVTDDQIAEWLYGDK